MHYFKKAISAEIEARECGCDRRNSEKEEADY